MSLYDEAGSSNSDSGVRNGVNRSLDRHSLSVKRATDSTRGTVAISAFKDTKSCKLILQFLQCVRMASGFSQTLALND